MRRIELSYQADSTWRFARLASRPWSAFLDSGWPRATRGRHDILVAEPYATIVTRGPETVMEDSYGRTVSDADPWLLLRRLLGAHRPGLPGLPFAGGAVGYFAYDLGRRIEHLPARVRARTAMPDMAVGLYDWAVVVDHLDRRAWLVDAGADEAAIRALRELMEQPPPAGPVPIAPSFQVLSPVRSEISREEYAAAFDRIQQHIRDGDCYQINFAQRFSAQAAGDPWDAYRWLRTLNPAPFAAYLAHPDGAVLSSSPERFLAIRDGEVETRPIKGTRPRSRDVLEDAALARELATSVKDRAENVMIVDLLRNDLGKSCRIGSIRVPELFVIESYATVHHLVSAVRGELAPDRHALEVLRGCFPGGSITGAPKLRAMQIIDELESHCRGVYCGAIGYIGFDGSMDTNIAIRTLVVHDGRMHCWAGGGIVADSRMQAEYQESLDKAAAMIALYERTRAPHVDH
ncbi:MAG: aminodeoxychorismate synthase component I [Gammaproteobacteria bacterium]|nr:aminodeoxychorismate synthase component I [Gammaproteobacteria bacterium]